MFFCLQSWKEASVWMFVSQSQHFWSQTFLIAPKESMIGTNSRGQGSDRMGQVGSLSVLRSDNSLTNLMQTACPFYTQSKMCAPISHVHIFMASSTCLIHALSVEVISPPSGSENRLLKEGKKKFKRISSCCSPEPGSI